MSQSSPFDVFKWVEKDLNSMKISLKTIKKHGGRGYFLEIDFENLVNLHKFHNDLPFYSQIMRTEKVEKLAENLHDRGEYVVHVRNLKPALNHGLLFKKMHRAIKFNQKACLKPLIDINTELRKKAKNHFEKDFFKLMNNAGFGKNMQNVGKHRYIKLVTTEKRRKYLVSQPNYHTKKALLNIY